MAWDGGTWLARLAGGNFSQAEEKASRTSPRLDQALLWGELLVAWLCIGGMRVVDKDLIMGAVNLGRTD